MNAKRSGKVSIKELLLELVKLNVTLPYRKLFVELKGFETRTRWTLDDKPEILLWNIQIWITSCDWKSSRQLIGFN